MDIQYYKEFADLAQTLNFHRTASNFFMSQSTLSKHISSLEKKLGVQLFYRSKYRVSLTDAGNKILPYVNKIILTNDELWHAIHPNAEYVSGSLRIGYFKNAVRTPAVNAIAQFSKVYPDISVQLQDYTMLELFSELRDDNIDVGISILVKETPLPSDTVIYPLKDDYLCVAVPKGHPLDNKEEVVFQELLDFPLILPAAKEYAYLYRLINRFISSATIKANIVCDYIDVQTALMMVEAGLGISILPHSIDSKETVHKIKLLDCQLDLKLGLIYKTTNKVAGLQELINVFSKI